MEVCKCGHLVDDHRWDGEHCLGCCCCNCEIFESQNPQSFRGHKGTYARIEAAFDQIKDQIDAILAAEEDLVKRSDLSAEIERLFVERLAEFRRGVKTTVDAEALASLHSK